MKIQAVHIAKHCHLIIGKVSGQIPESYWPLNDGVYVEHVYKHSFPPTFQSTSGSSGRRLPIAKTVKVNNVCALSFFQSLSQSSL